jgi:hypothetical protein
MPPFDIFSVKDLIAELGTRFVSIVFPLLCYDASAFCIGCARWGDAIIINKNSILSAA